MTCFCIKLDSKKPEVLELSGDVLTESLRVNKVRNPLKLSDYDFKVFLKESQAERYLRRFNKAAKKLKRLDRGGWAPGPSLIYKRHYLIQSYLGEKLQTYRQYNRGWKPGVTLKLYDQTYFLLVKLKRIKKTSNGFKYEFAPIKHVK